MKLSIFAGIAAASFAVTSVMAEDVAPLTIPAVTTAQAPVIDQVTKDVKATPENAAEIVKKTILASKADSLLVAQIMRAAMIQSPDQVDAIYVAVVAVAPDASGMVNLMAAAMLNGDEVAAASKKKIKKMLAKIFQNTTDLSVDDFNKNNKVLVDKEVLKQWTKATGGQSVEVKLDNFTYYISFGFNADNHYESVIISRDSSTLPPP